MKAGILILILSIGNTPLVYADISIQNDQKYFGDDGTLHIVGEIHNRFNSPLNQISVHATLYDMNNDVIAIKETRSLVNIIMPNMKSPFDFILTESDLKLTEAYSLNIDYKVSAPKDQVIDITSSKLSRDNLNNIMITGTVANKGEITANTIAVIATLYDNEGNVAGVSRAHIEPDYLKVDEEIFFFVTVPDKSQTTGISGYSLVAESEEYAYVPEFPIGLTWLLCGILVGYIGITKYSKRIITSQIFPTYSK